VTGGRGRRRKQLLDDPLETTGHLKLKQESPNHTLWRTRFGRVYGRVVRQTTKWTETMSSGMRVQLASVHWSQWIYLTDTILPIIISNDKGGEIWGSFSGVVEKSGLLGSDGVVEFVIPDVSERHCAFFLDSLTQKDKSIAFLQHVWKHQPNVKVSHPKRPASSMDREMAYGINFHRACSIICWFSLSKFCLDFVENHF